MQNFKTFIHLERTSGQERWCMPLPQPSGHLCEDDLFYKVSARSAKAKLLGEALSLNKQETGNSYS